MDHLNGKEKKQISNQQIFVYLKIKVTFKRMSFFTQDQPSDIKDFYLPFMNLLTDEQVEVISKNSNVVRYKNRDINFLQNTRTSHIMFIKTGLVKIYKEGRNGKILILRIETPSNYLGLMSVFGHDIHQFSAAAIDKYRVRK